MLPTFAVPPENTVRLRAKDLRPLPSSLIGRAIRLFGSVGDAPLLLSILPHGQCKDDELPCVWSVMCVAFWRLAALQGRC